MPSNEDMRESAHERREELRQAQLRKLPVAARRDKSESDCPPVPVCCCIVGAFTRPTHVTVNTWKDCPLHGKMTGESASPSEPRRDERERAIQIVIEEINSSTGPTGEWLDSPKAICAEIVARLEGGAARASAAPLLNVADVSRILVECGAWPGDRHEASCSKVTPSAGQTEGN